LLKCFCHFLRADWVLFLIQHMLLQDSKWTHNHLICSYITHSVKHLTVMCVKAQFNQAMTQSSPESINCFIRHLIIHSLHATNHLNMQQAIIQDHTQQ